MMMMMMMMMMIIIIIIRKSNNINNAEIRAEQPNKKRRYSEICEKQKNGLAFPPIRKEKEYLNAN